MYADHKITVVIPCLNEEEGIRMVLAGGVDEEQLLVLDTAAPPLVIYFRFAS